MFVLVLFYSVDMYIRAWHMGHKLTVSGVTIATDSDLPRKSVHLGLWMSTDEQVKKAFECQRPIIMMVGIGCLPRYIIMAPPALIE